MALNDAVPSSATDVFKRNAEDADRLLNATGNITTRTGKELPSWDEITKSHAAWNNRGAWTTATDYAVNDIWEDGGVWYVVLSAYTSGATAAVDIAETNVVVLSGNFVQGVEGLGFDEFAANKNLVYPVGSVEDLAGLVGVLDDQQISLKGWHPDSDVGGGILYWDAAKPKSAHNGGTVFSPTVPFSNDESIYNAATGETEPAGSGCWVRLTPEDIKFTSNRSLEPVVFDMHYGALKGVGQRDGEPVGQFDYTVTAAAAAGSKTIAISNTGGLQIGMGITVLCGDEYYTHTIKDVQGGSVTIKQPLSADVEIGQNVWNLWNDEAHVTIKGYYAVADELLRSELDGKTEVTRSSEFKPQSGGGVITEELGVNDVDLPGSFALASYKIETAGSPNQGAKLVFDGVGVGDYTIPLHINTGGKDTIVAIMDSVSGFTLWSDTINKSDCSTINANFRVFQPCNIIVNIICTTANTVYVDTLKLLRSGKTQIQLNRGKMVLFGDSWFAANHIFDRLAERLPACEVVNKGVSGNNAQNLLDRFDADVAPENPDFVWINTSTNDYYGSSDEKVFMWRVSQIIRKCVEIGATPIISSTTVGNVDTAPHRFDRSRNFFGANYYYDTPPAVSKSGQMYVNGNDVVVSAPAGSAKTVAQLGFFKDSVVFDTSYFTNKVEVHAGANLNTTSKVGDLAKGYNPAAQVFSLTGTQVVTLKAVNESGNEEVWRGYCAVSTRTSVDFS